LLGLPAVLLLGLVAGVMSGCTDEDTVFVDRPPFEEPAADNFLGYVGDPADQMTACGNCHATFQAGWETTGHAHAWEDLQASGHAQATCEGCHTISERGNPAEGDAGYNAVAVERYQDVQCESCHGAGFEHASGPTMANAPLCSIKADTAATVGCGECHNGTHHPFVEQWSLSRHKNVTAFAQGRAGCADCHEGRTALVRKFFETSDYLEKDAADPEPIVCVVCHDPHGTDFEANLRAPIDIAGTELPSNQHLCIVCHSRSGTPPSTHGPHAAQGLLVLQENIGWIPTGFSAPPLHPHGNPQINPEICVTCHVNMFEITDAETGAFEFQSVGHTFEAAPCLDADGKPDPRIICEDEERDFQACAECHQTEATALQIFVDNKNEISALLDQLWVDNDQDGVMDATDAGLLPQVVALASTNPADTIQLDPRDDVITVAEGAFWNAQISATDDRPGFFGAHFYVGLAGPNQEGIEWESHHASGQGVHNPSFSKALLQASIQAVKDFYGL
jgi:predicted CXXCH cytochrome family protein